MMAGLPASSALSNLRSVATNLVGHFAANVAPCGLLPREELSGDITNTTMDCLQLAVDLLDNRQVPGDADLVGLRDGAAQWAREGIPLEIILDVLHEGFRLGWRQIVSGARTDDIADMSECGELLISMLDRVTVVATSAYISELHIVASEHHTAVHTLTSALLSGRSTSAMARQCGIDIASEYVVLAVHFPRHYDESSGAVQPKVAARRKLRRVQAALAKGCEQKPLSLLSPDGGTILIPGAPEDEWVDALVEQMSVAAEVSVTATVAQAETKDIPEASDRTHELLDLAAYLDRPAGVYRMSDLVYEYQMTRPGAGREHLLGMLQPLERTPDLIKTLEVHIQNDLNRQRTARQLHVHTNTVDYRLKRIAELTGLDPGRLSGLRPLQAALVARALESAG